MKSSLFRQSLDAISKATGRSVHTTGDLRCTAMRGDTPRSAEKTVARAVRDGLLVRVCKGLYAYEYAPRRGLSIWEEIALRLRPKAFNYVSLESALSSWGVISQEMLGGITVMSTGRSLTLRTPYGIIDITHTAKRPADVAAQMVIPEPWECWLPYAKPRLAAADLRRVGRNVDLIDWDEIREVEREMAA